MIVILGGGPAGRTAAVRLGAAGEEVILVDRGGLGGQCLHHGCMVVCALADVARSYQEYRNLERLGVLRGEISVSFPQMLAAMTDIQMTITDVLREETESSGVTVISGEDGRVEGDRVFIGDREIEAESILIATGSRPIIPPLPGIELDGVYSAHTLSQMPELPGRIAIIGGGVMAAEFASVLAARSTCSAAASSWEGSTAGSVMPPGPTFRTSGSASTWKWKRSQV
jgi:dihydrolipoamide dehydrogenase